MALSNYDRVGKAVQLLAEGLAPFVERECRAKFGDNWLDTVQRKDRGGIPREVNPADLQFLLKVMRDEWDTIFGKKLSPSDRGYVFELQGVRNDWAHNNTFSTDDALRALDTAQRLLESVAAGAQANEVGKFYQDLLRQKCEQMWGARRKEGQPATGLPARQRSVVGATLFGTDRSLRSAIELLDFVAVQLYERHGQDLLDKVAQISGRKVQISRDPMDIDRPRETGAPGIFIDRNLTIAGIKARSYEWLRLFGYPNYALQIHYSDSDLQIHEFSSSPRAERRSVVGATLFGTDRSLRSAIELLDFVAVQLYERHGQDLLDKVAQISGRKVQISRDPMDIDRPRETGAPGIFIDRNLTIAGIKARSYEWLRLFGYPDSALQIHER